MIATSTTDDGRVGVSPAGCASTGRHAVERAITSHWGDEPATHTLEQRRLPTAGGAGRGDQASADQSLKDLFHAVYPLPHSRGRLLFL